MTIGIFREQKEHIQKDFYSKFSKEIETFNKLLGVYEAFLLATSGKIKNTDFPKWTIEILLSQTLPLMDNAVNLLSKGYLRSSEIFIRVVSEAVILSIYFAEFPQAEEEYRKTPYMDFFHNHKIDKMLKKIQNEGKIFIKSEPNKKISWNKIIFTNLYKEASKFVHNNPDVIYSLIKLPNSQSHDKDMLVLGPQLYSDDVLSMSLRRLFNTLLFSLVVLGISLNIMPDSSEKSIMDEASEIINRLLGEASKSKKDMT